MKKIAFLFVLILTICSCSFIIDRNASTPSSTHIPSVNTGNVFSTLKGTVWKLSSSSQDFYLYIDKYEDKYAIKAEKRGVSPERYPNNHDYTILGEKQDSSSAHNDIVVFEKRDYRDQYIGFYLKGRFTLDVAESSGSTTSLITSLTDGTGISWSLYY